jgi:hypothetical protein
MWLWRGLLVWLLMMFGESVLGFLRGAFLVERMGDMPARQAGAVVSILWIYGLTYLTWRWLRLHPPVTRWWLGVCWMVWTLGFEVALGRWVMGGGWELIIRDYDLRQGGLMLPGIILLGLAPYLVGFWWGRRGLA